MKPKDYLEARYSKNRGWTNHLSLPMAKTQHGKNARRVQAAWKDWLNKDRPIRILAIAGSGRHPLEGCAHRESNSKMLMSAGLKAVEGTDVKIDLVKLREFMIEPCNGCYSTASTWCHWPCLPASERVMTAEGLKSIAELKPGDAIVGGVVTKAWQSSPKADVFRLTLKDGRSVRLTANHRVKVQYIKRRMSHGREYETKWVEAGDLKPGDRIPWPDIDPNTPGIWGKDSGLDLFAYELAGLVWGDGSYCGKSGRQVRVYYHERETEFAALVAESSPWDVVDYPHAITDYDEMRYLGWTVEIGRLLRDEMGIEKGPARTRRIPERIMNASQAEVCGFLRGWFSTDGSCDSTKKRGRVSLSCASVEALRDAQLLLMRLGIRSSVYDNNHLTTTMRGKTTPRASSLEIRPWQSINRFDLHIGFIHPRKQAALRSALETFKPKRKGFHDRMENLFSEVEFFEPDGSEAVYDIEVSPSHEFIAEGIIVHNCDCFPWDGMNQAADGGEGLYEKSIRADVILMATGVNQSMCSTRIKAYMDRLISADGGIFIPEDEFQWKGEEWLQKLLSLAAKGEFSYSPRLALRPCGFFITSKDEENALGIESNDEPGELKYKAFVARAMKSSMEDYGCLFADPWYAWSSANPHEEMMFDAAHHSKDTAAHKQAEKVVKAAVELAKKARKNPDDYLMKTDRINRT